MKKICKTALFALLFVISVVWELLPEQSAHADGVDFEVACWNMRWFPSGYMEKQSPAFEARRMALTARLMRRQGIPDVFFAQEIRSMEVCKTFAENLQDPNFQPIVCSAFIYPETNDISLQQLAIFSRYPAVESGFKRWNAADFVFPPRGYAYAILDIDGSLVACFNVHLKSNYIPDGLDKAQQTVLNRLKRELSSQQLLAKAEELREKGVNGRPVTRFILAGDFNTARNEDRFATETTLRDLLVANFIHAHDGLEGEAYATLPTSKYYPFTTFDFIFYRGLQKAGEPSVLPAVWISDHREIRIMLNTGD